MVRKSWPSSVFWGVVILLIFASPAIGGPPARDAATALHPLVGDTDSVATDINNRGQVAGRSVGATTTAVRWDRHGQSYGGPVMLLPIGGDLLSFGEAINNRGEVVGTSRSGAGSCAAFAVDTAVVWDRHGRPRALNPLPGDAETRGYGINNRGITTGISLGPRRPDCSASFTGVVWDRNGNPTPLASPSAVLDETFGADINQNGVVVGFNNTFDGSAFNATVWDRQGVPTNLPTLAGGNFELANGLNNRGDVVGTDFVSFMGQLWDKWGNLTVLPPFGTDIFSTAVDINGRGQTIGSSFSGGFAETAVVWDEDGVPTVRPPLPGDTESSGLGINDPGQTVGLSRDSGGTSTAVIWR